MARSRTVQASPPGSFPLRRARTHEQITCQRDAQRRPEQPVPRTQTRARTRPLEDGDLLPQRQDFQGSVAPTAEENSNRGKKSKDELGHEISRCSTPRPHALRLLPKVPDCKASPSFGYLQGRLKAVLPASCASNDSTSRRSSGSACAARAVGSRSRAAW